MAKDEKGSVVVETLGSFMLFAFLMVAILTLINIATLQARVHYALTQTALELSMYSHVIHVIGLTEHFKTISAGAEATGELIGSVQDNIAAIQGAATGAPGSPAETLSNLNVIIDASSNLFGHAGDVMDDPRGMITNLLHYGLAIGQQEFIIRPLFHRHLATDEEGAGEYLRRRGVIPSQSLWGGMEYIDLGESVLINADGDIIIIAEYRIRYIFGALPLPTAARELTVRQQVKTRAWIGGDSQ